MSCETGTCWNDFQLRIRRESFDEQGGLRADFLRHGILAGAMHCPQFQLGRLIWRRLASDPFGSLLLARVQASPVGAPVLLPQHHLWSTVDLQTLLYVQLWKSLLGVDAAGEVPFHFVDFGGGYGLFARAIAMLGQDNTVDVVDLPVVSRVQELYHAETLNSQQRARISYLDGVEEVQKGHLFHSTYALSETTLPARERLVRDLVAGSSRFLIVYQDTFRDTLTGGPIDNHAWFNGPFRELVPAHRFVGVAPICEGSHVICGANPDRSWW